MPNKLNFQALSKLVIDKLKIKLLKMSIEWKVWWVGVQDRLERFITKTNFVFFPWTLKIIGRVFLLPACCRLIASTKLSRISLCSVSFFSRDKNGVSDYAVTMDTIFILIEIKPQIMFYPTERTKIWNLKMIHVYQK